MHRRKFIKLTSAAGFFTLLPHEVFSALRTMGVTECPDITGKKLVLIHLAGANDGLNTIVPVNQYDKYAAFRPTLKLKESGIDGIVNLDTTLSLESQVGLHPVLTGFKDLYEKGQLRIIQGVGYPEPNKSHFKSTDLWLTGGDGRAENFSYESGWAGRFMENNYTALLDAQYPLGIQMGSGDNSLGFHGEIEHGMSVSINNQDEAGFYSVINGLGGSPPTNIPDSEYGDLIRYLIDLDASTNFYAKAISAAFASGSNTQDYPQTDMANQLKTVARLISGGLGTKIYLVRLGGFDTHEWQATTAGGAHNGYHANLLRTVSDAVNSFITDLNEQGKGDDVIAMTFSEFGRKIAENGNLGTDHGEVAPMFLFGKSVEPGISGTNINLNEANQGNNYQVSSIQYDYRSVFTTILQDWMGAKTTVLDKTFYDNRDNSGFTNKKISGILKAAYTVPASCYSDTNPIENFEIKIYPNPCSDYITLNYPDDNSIYDVTILSANGAYLHAIPNTSNFSPMTINTQHLAAGLYYFKITGKKGTITKKIIVRK